MRIWYERLKKLLGWPMMVIGGLIAFGGNILDILVAARRYSENEIVEAENIANQLNIGVSYIHEELDKMEYLDLVKLYKTLGPKYSAQVTPKGLLTHEQAGKD